MAGGPGAISNCEKEVAKAGRKGTWTLIICGLVRPLNAQGLEFCHRFSRMFLRAPSGSLDGCNRMFSLHLRTYDFPYTGSI